MSGRTSPVCAVCGMGGYWVAFSPRHGEERCLNHLDGMAAAVDRALADAPPLTDAQADRIAAILRDSPDE